MVGKYLAEKKNKPGKVYLGSQFWRHSQQTGKARQESWQLENVAETPHMTQPQKVRA